MESGVYKFNLPAPATVNKVSSTRFLLDPKKGSSFFIKKAFLQIPDRDAKATTDAIGFQISTRDNSDGSTLFEITSEFAIYTWYKDETFTQDDRGLDYQPKVCIPLDDIEGTMLPQTFYLNHLITGQDGAIDAELVIEGNYSNKELDSDYHNKEF